MQDVFEFLLRVVGGVIRIVIEGLLDWFWESGVRKFSWRLSQVGPWWREETTLSKFHSFAAVFTVVLVFVFMAVLIAALMGFDPFGIDN